MIQKCSYPAEQLVIDPIKVTEIIYDKVPLKTRQEKIKGKRFTQTMEKVREKYLHFIEPFCFYRPIEVELIREIFGESMPPHSPIYKAVDSWKDAAVFICSIGRGLESSVRNLQEKGDLYEAFFLDACGSVIADDLAKKVEKMWANPILEKTGPKEGYTIYSNRYSPGYCRWDVSGQFALFGYAADADLPVSLTDNAMMSPRKSVSGILVLEEAPIEEKLTASCRVCENRCPYVRLIENLK